MATTLPELGLKEWHATGDTFAFKNHRVFFRTSGDGTPLIVIHGFPTCGWDWAWVEPEISRHFTLYVPDMLDYGASRNEKGKPATIFDQADMIEALAHHQGLKAVHLLIHDVGDTVGQELLARRKDKKLSFAISSVVYLNGGMIPDHHRPRPMQKLLAGPFGTLLARLMGKEKFVTGLADVFGAETKPDAALGDALWDAAIGVNGKPAFARRIRYMKERRDNAPRWVGALQQADLAMLLINGLDDPVSGAHAADAFAERVPHAEIARLKGIGHFPQIEAPELVTSHFLAFHERLKA